MSLAEALYIFSKYGDPKKLNMDFCIGTSVSVMAWLLLGQQGIANDRDERALALGQDRARCYMDFILSETAKTHGAYPQVGTGYVTKHDGSNLHAWITHALRLTEKQNNRLSNTSRTVVVGMTNFPFGQDRDRSDADQNLVCGVLFVCAGYVLRMLYNVCVCAQYLESMGLLVKEVPEIAALEGAVNTRGLYTTANRREGDIITGFYGKYMLRLAKGKGEDMMDVIALKFVPGTSSSFQFILFR